MSDFIAAIIIAYGVLCFLQAMFLLAYLRDLIQGWPESLTWAWLGSCIFFLPGTILVLVAGLFASTCEIVWTALDKPVWRSHED